jgi:hypothetical protein
MNRTPAGTPAGGRFAEDPHAVTAAVLNRTPRPRIAAPRLADPLDDPDLTFETFYDSVNG